MAVNISKKAFFLVLALFMTQVWADTKQSQVLELKKLSANAYAIVGELSNRTLENLANNATFGFVVTSQGVVLIDSGGTYNGAKAIHEIIQTVTDKPIVKVINSGGQDHRWMGNDYFKKQGAEIIASKNAVKDQKAREQDQFFRLAALVGDAEIKRTNPVYADTVFDKKYNFELGGIRFEITHAGQAHTPGDSFVWLPQNKIMFTGDIVYTERMIGILDHSNSESWVKVFETMAKFNPQILVPGHGHPTTLKKAQQDTYHYLTSLRAEVTKFMDDDGDASDIGSIDQSAFKYLFNFKNLSGRNALQVFTEMEWE